MTKCIIIPCYQEYENINIILFEINKYKIDNLLVVIVDDSEISYEHNIKNQNFQIVYLNRKKKEGRGSAVLYGIDYVLKLKKDISLIIEMDADMSHNPNELLRNIDLFKKQNLDLLISSRYLADSKIINWPLKRKILSFLSNKLSKYLLGVPVSDYTNGYRVYSVNSAKFIINNCGKIGDGYIVLSEILTMLFYNNFKIGEISTVFINRIKGESNVTVKEIFFSLIGLYKIWRIKINIK
jgi:dolichol-phosphate mannosyltransferase